MALCNAGVMAFDGVRALEILDRIGNANSKGEYYLVDAVTIVREMGLEAVVIETSEDEGAASTPRASSPKPKR